MKEHVTVIPADSIIMVNGEGIYCAYTAPQDVHAVQWHNEEGHVEYVNGTRPNRAIRGEAEYEDIVSPYVEIWEKEKARLEELEVI